MRKVAAIQMCSSNGLEHNLETASRLIKEAALNHAKLVVLPEMFPMMGVSPKDKIDIKEKYGVGIIQDTLSKLAKAHKVWIVGGTIPIACENENKVSASCLVYDDGGNLKGKYDKIHLFDVQLSDSEAYRESDTTQPGNDIVVINTPFGKLGLAVCYDLRFPKMFTHMAKLGVEIIAVPTAFTKTTGTDHWDILTKARALDTFSYIIGACQYGMHPSKRETYGHSLIVDPWGQTISELSTSTDGVIYADIDLDYVHKIRNSIPTLQNQIISPDMSKRSEKKSRNNSATSRYKSSISSTVRCGLLAASFAGLGLFWLNKRFGAEAPNLELAPKSI